MLTAYSILFTTSTEHHGMYVILNIMESSTDFITNREKLIPNPTSTAYVHCEIWQIKHVLYMLSIQRSAVSSKQNLLRNLTNTKTITFDNLIWCSNQRNAIKCHTEFLPCSILSAINDLKKKKKTNKTERFLSI